VTFADRRLYIKLVRSLGQVGFKKENLTASGPFRATKFFRTLSIAASGMTVLPSFNCGVTSTDSHSIGA